MSRPGPHRLESGGLIDRSCPVAFSFNGVGRQGFRGDTLASALLANGVRTVARSFKFHRPRGVFTCGIEEPNALLRLGSGAAAVPTARAPTVELYEGLSASSQSGWPSVDFDVGRVLDAVPGLWAAGFYNKAFMWPSWHFYEGFIRSMAGLGRAPTGPDPDRYETGNLHCDVLVIGGGLAGLAAAHQAAGNGLRVILAEQDAQLGGRALWDGTKTEGQRMAAVLAQLRNMPDVAIYRRTTAVGYYDHDVVALVERSAQPAIGGAARERLWIVRAKRVVLATGEVEQPLIFDNNDRPGILLCGAARQYLRRYGVAPGLKVVVATNNDSAYLVVADLRAAGVDVACVVDSRAQIPESTRLAMRWSDVEIASGTIPVTTSGFSALRSVTVGRLAKEGRGQILSTKTYACDALLVSGGWNPALHLYAQAGGKLVFEPTSGALAPAHHLVGTQIVGAAASDPRQSPVGPRSSPVGKSQRQWVDLLHDVTVADLELALRERYTSVEHVKRYTTVGMAADQGKTSTIGAIDTLARLRGIRPEDLGYTTQRPPYTPVTLGTIVGRDTGMRFSPTRVLPMHEWHHAHGAAFQDFGGWQRPVAYLRPGEAREQAVVREARAVRRAVGLFDGSPLGKIELRGPDALAFADRFYINNLQTLQQGRIRYGIMLRESGIIFDDGTVTLLRPDHVLISTTSGNASRVVAWMEEWHQCEWPDLQVAIFPVTEQWATLSLTGPAARTVLSRLDTDIDLAADAFAHLSLREGRILGYPTRLARVSFTGELTYEISVPTAVAPRLWDTLMEAGAPEGIEPLGLDALLLLRLEKGFLHVGTDTDGTTIPDDVGWGKPAAAKKVDYIGKRSLLLPEYVRAGRLQLVGLAAQGTHSLVIGSHLRLKDSEHATDGWITSAGTMIIDGQPIALAMLRAGRQQVGAEVSVHDMGTVTSTAKVVPTPFFDPDSVRMHA